MSTGLFPTLLLNEVQLKGTLCIALPLEQEPLMLELGS